MSRKRQMIELLAPSVMRLERPERFKIDGFTCPTCNGNGWGWRKDDSSMKADRRGWGKEKCATCGGTGEVVAEVTISWRGKHGKEE